MNFFKLALKTVNSTTEFYLRISKQHHRGDTQKGKFYSNGQFTSVYLLTGESYEDH